MNRGGGVGGGGPTAAAAASAAQKQKILLQKDADVGNLVDNFGFLVNVARVQAAESLLKLVSELKQTAIFMGFASLNDHVEQKTNEFNESEENTNRALCKIGKEAAASLKELESDYCSSAVRNKIRQVESRRQFLYILYQNNFLLKLNMG